MVSLWRCRASRRVRFIKIGAVILLVLVFLLLLIAGGRSPARDLLPQGDRLENFFKEPFLAFCIICFGWFVQALRMDPQRRDQVRYLVSLPSSGRAVYHFIFFTEWRGLLWVPACLGLIYTGLAVMAPWPYLCRLALITLLFHAMALLAVHTGHLLFMLRTHGRINFLIKVEALFLLPAILLFAAAVLSGLIWPAAISGASFGLVLAVSLLLMFGGLELNSRLFTRWLLSAALYRVPVTRRKIIGSSQSLELIGRRANPWLWKYLMRGRRQPNRSLLILTAVFIVLASLAAMNNRLASDRTAVLLALTLFYASIYVYQFMAQSSGAEEPPAQLYALPVRTLDRFSAMMIPAAAWLAGCFLITGALVARWSLSLAAGFWIRTALIGTAMLLCGVLWTLAHYPDLKKAQSAYSYTLLAAVIGSALFYPFHPFIIAALALLPLWRLRSLRYFRT